MKKKLVSVLLIAALTAAAAAGCGNRDNNGNAADDKNASNQENEAADNDNGGEDDLIQEVSGSVYYLNFKPEQAQQWKDLAEEYSDETGIPVTIETAASGTYESTLKSEMAKSEAPTLFQVNGPAGLAAWKDYCYDLKDSTVYKNLKSDDFALISDDGQVQGVAYVIETYGLIYNKDILEDYCETNGAKIKDVSEINSFAKLKEVADDMQAKKDELGIKGAFASAGMDSSSDWRFKTHLANLPIYFEYKDDNLDTTDAIKGTYLDAYKNMWDLYITDSTVESTMLSGMTGKMQRQNFPWVRLRFTRTAHGRTMTLPGMTSMMKTWECFLFI